MKKSITRYFWNFALLLVGFNLSSWGLQKGIDPSETQIVPKMFLSYEDGLVGYWDYTVPNAPYEYSKGAIVISKSEGTFSVVVQLNGGSINGEDVKVNGNEINFKVYIEGDVVSVTLTAVDDTISGNSISSQGSMAIEGKRGAMPE